LERNKLVRKIRTRAGVAVIAVAAAVGALAVPALIGSASALPPPATPTTLVLDSAQNVTETVTAPHAAIHYKIDVDSTVPAGAGIFVAATSGPDSAITSPYNIANAQECTPVHGIDRAGPFDCVVDPSLTATTATGTDQLVFFYSTALTPAVYDSSLPHTTGTLTIPGALAQINLTPVTSHVAQGMYQCYSVSAIDSNGNPMNGFNYDVLASQPNGATTLLSNGLQPIITGSCADNWQGHATALSPNVATTRNGSGTIGSDLSDPISIASQVVGTVTVTVTKAGVVPPTSISAVSTLTINPGTANDAASVTVTPDNSHIFQNATATETVQALNAQGDVIGDWNGRRAAGPTGPTTTDIVPQVDVISGPNVNQTVTVAHKPNSNALVAAYTGVPVSDDATLPVGTFVATYHTLAPSTTTTTLGDDKVQAWVNQSTHSPNTEALQTGEPTTTVTVHIVDKPIGINVYCLNSNNSRSNPCNTLTPSTANHAVTQVYTLWDNAGNLDTTNGILSNIPVDLSIVSSNSTVNPGSVFSVSPTAVLSDANGRFNATFTDSNPVVGDTMTVKAVLDGDSSRFTLITITWGVPVDTVMIQPYVNTLKNGGTAAFTVSTVDNNGAPVSGLHYTWTALDGIILPPPTAFATGTGTTFGYTDARSPQSDHFDRVSVLAFDASNHLVGSDSVNQYWARGGTSQQTAIDVDDFSGTFSGQGVNFADPPFTPAHFQKSAVEHVTANPTTNQGCSTPVAPNPGGCPVAIGVKLSDANNNLLFGKTVTFTTSGVGQFTDASGHPIGTTTTARVDDNRFDFAVENGGPTVQNYGFATVYVASTQGGDQTIVATADGIPDTGIVHWQGQGNFANPIRVFDTRIGTGGAGGVPSQPATPVHPNQITTFAYSDTPLPTNATAYVFNVTAIHPNHVGNLRISTYTGSATLPQNTPDTSLINYQVGKDTANAVIVGGAVVANGLTVYSDGAIVNVAVDLEGYFTTNGYQPLHFPSGASTVRAADTRTGLGVGSAGKLAAGASKTINLSQLATNFLADHNGHALKSVSINVTAIHPSGAGNLRVYASGQPVPNVSNINFIPGADKAAFDVVNLPANGSITVTSDGAATDFTVDVFGFADDRANVTSVTPTRVVDTRPGSSPADSFTTPIPAHGSISFPVAGLAGVPADAQAVIVSVTSIHAVGSNGIGNLRVYPKSGAVPNTSIVNYISPGADVANFAYISLGAGGQLTAFNDSAGKINAAVDVLGYIPAGS
jgi:hypothetical protein